MDSLVSRFRNEVLNHYVELVQAKYRFHPVFEHAQSLWREQLSPDVLVNGPYLEQSQTYMQGKSLADLPLDDLTRKTIEERLSGRPLWSHQSKAILEIIKGNSTVITTGTSSGKTLCYQIPILNDLLRNPSPGLRAIIIYPLNALVNDQLSEWEDILKNHNDIKFARFTGQTPSDQWEYEKTLRETFNNDISMAGINQQEKNRKVEDYIAKEIEKFPNRLNHREAIRAKPPQILITNFSMLEYLLERPVDAPIFEKACLKFIVLDEAHAYRGIQATEIACLLRRLKDRLQPDNIVCVATSATLGDRNDPASLECVRKYASDIFGEPVNEPSPIMGEDATPKLEEPAFAPGPKKYIDAAAEINRGSDSQKVAQVLGTSDIAKYFKHDENLFRLRTKILTKPTLLKKAAQELWPHENEDGAIAGLSAMLEILACKEDTRNLLSTRLHYFVKAQDGLHICLNPECPGRHNKAPAFFVSRHNKDVPDGLCPKCFINGNRVHSQLVEIVGCRRCGYLFGALQDMGPRYAQDPDHQSPPEPIFDTFSTELGWSAESFWSYFSVDHDLPFPQQPKDSDDDDENEKMDIEDLLHNPVEVQWCVKCGKRYSGQGDICQCKNPCIRTLNIFHRQCPVGIKAKDVENIYQPEKKLLKKCPNCGTRRGSGPEPLQRFQESEDAMGTAMAIPLSHFDTRPDPESHVQPKLLCFTDNRQRAAAFPSILEEETFTYEFSCRMFSIISKSSGQIGLIDISHELAKEAENEPQAFFLPASRDVDDSDQQTRRNIWMSEVFGYFTLSDPRRESIEDLGLIELKYQLNTEEQQPANELFSHYNLAAEDTHAALQTLLAIMRRRKAISLPKGVDADSYAFGPITNKVAYSLNPGGRKWTHSWIPAENRINIVIDYIQRLIKCDRETALNVAEDIWRVIIPWLIKDTNGFILDHERLLLRKATERYVCRQCGFVTNYSALNCCPRLECTGSLASRPFDPSKNIIACWISKAEHPMFRELRAEEHTAQIKKDFAKIIEDRFRDDEGVNLISSTTTFEMGINIGSLQKVLLRNAPPSSANYIQRVGRAGRGADKNAICVTICRRSKYDSDMWREPLRLMTGTMHTPTVFLDNKIIFQRHFNAVAFATFLRDRVLSEKAIGEVKQVTPVEVFLNLELRRGIPEAYHQKGLPDAIHLDFRQWLQNKTTGELFQTVKCMTDFESRLGFEAAKKEASDKYGRVIEGGEQELSAMIKARKKASDAGMDSLAKDLGCGIKNLLTSDIINFLAEGGFLPRYAFPLDLVRLETAETRWSNDSEVELSRSRSIAISEYAPGAQVIARKNVYTSAGLYVLGERDTPKKRWYSKCNSCGQIRIGLLQEDVSNKSCDVCQKALTRQHTHPFVIPDAFSIKIEKESRRRPQRYRADTLIRQRQGATHFIDQIADSQFEDKGLFHLALKERGNLFRYNCGPRGEGFVLCRKCGFSEPMFGHRQSGKPHPRLRAMGGLDKCDGDPWQQIAYGHKFESFCLVIRPNRPLDSAESLAYALQKGLCKMLEVETQEIGVSLRNQINNQTEIILYDQTPGGAGFVREARDKFDQVITKAIDICGSCSCEKACYDCLKDYGNQSFHDKLDRHSVRKFLIRQ